MIETLENKLFQYEMANNGKHRDSYMIYLAEEIFELLDRIKSKGLFYTLTPNERKIIDKIREEYKVIIPCSLPSKYF